MSVKSVALNSIIHHKQKRAENKSLSFLYYKKKRTLQSL